MGGVQIETVVNEKKYCLEPAWFLFLDCLEKVVEEDIELAVGLD